MSTENIIKSLLTEYPNESYITGNTKEECLNRLLTNLAACSGNNFTFETAGSFILITKDDVLLGSLKLLNTSFTEPTPEEYGKLHYRYDINSLIIDKSKCEQFDDIEEEISL